MAKENFVLISLDDKKAKTIANVVGSETSRKILDALADKDTTETDLSEKLGIPISTVHYNLQQLMDAGLVVVEEFHYSKKGREVNHYKLANKYIIIAPKTEGLAQKLRGILPIAVFAAGASFIVYFFSMFGTTMNAAAEKVAVSRTFAADSAESIAQAAPQAEVVIVQEPTAALWFGAGAAFVLLTLFIWKIVHK